VTGEDHIRGRYVLLKERLAPVVVAMTILLEFAWKTANFKLLVKGSLDHSNPKANKAASVTCTHTKHKYTAFQQSVR